MRTPGAHRHWQLGCLAARWSRALHFAPFAVHFTGPLAQPSCCRRHTSQFEGKTRKGREPCQVQLVSETEFWQRCGRPSMHSLAAELRQFGSTLRTRRAPQPDGLPSVWNADPPQRPRSLLNLRARDGCHGRGPLRAAGGGSDASGVRPLGQEQTEHPARRRPAAHAWFDLLAWHVRAWETARAGKRLAQRVRAAAERAGENEVYDVADDDVR